MSLIEEVRKKREFSGLPNSIVERALSKSGNDVKEARKFLRKYFGVFLTNRVLKGKGDLLGIHVSSRKRDYESFYRKIFESIANVKSIVDLGCGVNGFSYGYLKDIIGDVDYVGIEAAGQLVKQMNIFFKEKGFDAHVIRGDLFNAKRILEILKKAKKERVVFLFQVVDALENMKKDFSKELILELMKECEILVISLPLVSLGGRKRFAVSRKWLIEFLTNEFIVKKDFEMFGERVLVIGKR